MPSTNLLIKHFKEEFLNLQRARYFSRTAGTFHLHKLQARLRSLYLIRHVKLCKIYVRLLYELKSERWCANLVAVPQTLFTVCTRKILILFFMTKELFYMIILIEIADFNF